MRGQFPWKNNAAADIEKARFCRILLLLEN